MLDYQPRPTQLRTAAYICGSRRRSSRLMDGVRQAKWPIRAVVVATLVLVALSVQRHVDKLVWHARQQIFELGQPSVPPSVPAHC